MRFESSGGIGGKRSQLCQHQEFDDNGADVNPAGKVD